MSGGTLPEKVNVIVHLKSLNPVKYNENFTSD